LDQLVRLRGRRFKRIHDGDGTKLAPALKILAEEISASSTLGGGDDQGIPERDLCLIGPMPGALNETNCDVRWIPFEHKLDTVASNSRRHTEFSKRVPIEFLENLPTQSSAVVLP